MKILKTLALVVLFIIFVVAGGIFLLGKGIEATLLQTSFYEKIVREAEVAPVLTDAILEGIEDQAGSEFEQLPAENREEMQRILEDSFSRALTEEWAEETLLMVIDDVLSYVKGEQDELTAVIDLSERKAIIQENIQAETQAEVEAEVERQIQQREIPAGMEDRARSQLEAEISPRIDTAVSGMMNNIPDAISLAQLLEAKGNSQEIKAAVNRFQQTYGYFDVISYAVLIVLAGLMLVLAGFFGGLKWVGTGMIVTGLLRFGTLFGAEQSLPAIINNAAPGLKTEKLNILIDPLFTQMYNITWIYAGIGLLLLLVGIIGKKSLKQDL